jgi:hypothetical protein
MRPDDIGSLNADTLKGLVLSLLARIDDLAEQNKMRIEVGRGRETNNRLLPFLHKVGGGGQKINFFQSWMGFLLNWCRRHDDPESALVI